MAGMDSEVNSLTRAALWQDLVGTRTGWRPAAWAGAPPNGLERPSAP
jgi:hypothetical protein